MSRRKKRKPPGREADLVKDQSRRLFSEDQTETEGEKVARLARTGILRLAATLFKGGFEEAYSGPLQPLTTMSSPVSRFLKSWQAPWQSSIWVLPGLAYTQPAWPPGMAPQLAMFQKL